MTHDKLQQSLFLYIWNTYPQARRTFWHTPNELLKHQHETTRDFMIRLSQRKAIGVLPGVVDLVFYWSGVLYMFDIKVGLDHLSETQLAFIKANEVQGGKFYEIRSIEQGKEIINNILTTHEK